MATDLLWKARELEESFGIASESEPREPLEFGFAHEWHGASGRYCLLHRPKNEAAGVAVLRERGVGHEMLLRLGRHRWAQVDSTVDGDRRVSIESERGLFSVQFLGDNAWRLEGIGLVWQRWDGFEVFLHVEGGPSSLSRKCRLGSGGGGEFSRWISKRFRKAAPTEEATQIAFSPDDGPGWFELGALLVFVRLRNQDLFS
jgi:hypothetical protein